MTPAQITFLDDTVYLDYHVLRQVSSTRAVVLISWSSNGIVDTVEDPTYSLEVTEEGSMMVGLPLNLTGTQAYDSHYSTEVDLWDCTKEHALKLTINGTYERLFTIPPLSTNTPVVEPLPFEPSAVTVELLNIDLGLKINLKACSPSFRKEVKNVRIERGIGVVPLQPRYVSSVAIPLILPSSYTEYGEVNIKGKAITSPTALQLDPIYLGRQDFIARVEYQDDFNDYIVESNQDLIDNTPAHMIVSVASLLLLDPQINNDRDLLYYLSDTEVYMKYRPYTVNLPYQATNLSVDSTSKYIDLVDLDPDLDGQFDLYVDGTVSPSGTVSIRSGVRSSIKDYTSYSTTTTVSNTLLSYLDTGVNFMDEFSSHVDTDVLDGSIYVYKVVLDTWDGKEHTIFTGTKKRETPTKSSIVPAGMNLEDLTIPLVGDSALSEYDFQSGVSHSGCKVFLSTDLEDLKLYARNKKLEEDCKCRNL